MSRFTGRVSRDLQLIADRATPSSTARESIRARIDSQPDQPDLEVTMLAPDDNKRPHRRALAALVAAAAAVVIVVGIVALTADDDSPDTAVTPDPPVVDDVPPPEEGGAAAEAVQVALDYIAAVDAWDGPATAALVAEDAVFEGGRVTPDEQVANAEFERAIDFRLLDPNCAASSPETPIEVACTFTVRNAWSEAIGLGPLTDSGWVLTIDGGQIVELREEPGFDPGFGTAWQAFRAWVGVNHPDDVETMYDASGVRLDSEAISLFGTYTAEYGAYRVALDYMAARDSWDGPATAALVAEDAVFGDGPTTDAELVANAEFERAIDFRLLRPDCAASSPEAPAEVACSFTVRNAWSEALGLGPLTDSGWVLVIDGGQVVELREEPGFDPGFGVAWNAFRAWVQENRPEDFDKLYEGGGVRLDSEAISLFETYTAEFVADQAG